MRRRPPSATRPATPFPYTTPFRSITAIATGLLHDTLEDTVATSTEIEKNFGKDVLRRVDGVTKLSRIELQSDRTRQAENFRKLLLAMSNDIRVLLVKLADRLHNMRTLHFIGTPEDRKSTSLNSSH